MIIIENAVNKEELKFCPKCGNHCPVGQFQCGRGRRWWNDPNAEEDVKDLFGDCARIYQHRREKKHGQRRVIRILKENEGKMNQRDLAKILDVRPGSLSELLIKMEEKGLIKREKLEEDRRNYIVSLSEKTELEAKKEPHQHKDLFAVLTDEEKKQLAGMLKKLKEAWKEEEPEQKHGHHRHHEKSNS